MKFKEKIKTRMYIGIALMIIGVVIVISSFFNLFNNDFLASFGTCFLVIGAVRVMRYTKLLNDDESLKKQEVSENDERNVMIYKEARSLTFVICMLVLAMISVVLYMFDKTYAAKILSYVICLILFVYWICYAIIRKRN